MRTKTTILNPWRFSLRRTLLLLTMVLGVAFVWQAEAQTPEVPIGQQDGSTSYLPIYSCYGYSYSQQLVYSSEINASGDITSISFFYNNSTATTNEDSVDWDIYLGHTSQTAFADTEDWVDYASLEEVFSGTVTFPAEGEWMTITFDNPFTYNGTDNLVVGVDQNTPEYNCSIYFGRTEDLENDRSIYYRNDSTNPDPETPPTAYSTTNYINTMILGGIQQACPFPGDLAVSDVTQTTATLAWTEKGSADEWEVIYGETGFDVENEGTTTSVSTNPSTTLSDLDHSTFYDFYVKAICDENEESFIAGPSTFSTACGIASVPYLLDFETAIAPDLPNCTSQENNGIGNDWKTKSSSTSGFTGNVLNYSYHPSSNPGPANSWFYTQGIELEAGVNYDISYKYGNNSTFYTESMKVAYGTSPSESAMTNELADYPEIELPSGQPEDALITFTVDSDGVYYFGFNAYSIENQNQLYVDDINIVYSPSCPAPSDLAATAITEDSVDLTWIESTTATQWEVVYGESGFDVETEGESMEITDDPNVTLTDLTQNTLYDFYVKAICNEEDESIFAGPMTFTTGCGIASIPYVLDFENADVPNLPNCTTKENNGIVGNDWKTIGSATNFDGKVLNYSYHSFLDPGTANSWFYTQGIELEAGESYDITYKYGNNSTIYTESMKVAYGTSPEEADMTNELADYPEIELSSPEKERITFTVDTDGVYYFGFNVYSIENQNQLYVDDIAIDFTPTCPMPSDLSASNITENTADLAWIDNAGATQWEVIYGETEFDMDTEGTTVSVDNDPEITLSDLTENTQYDFYVKAICDTDDESTLVGPTSFKTACDPMTDLFEDFEEYSTGSIVPDCWDRLVPETSPGSQTITSTSPASGERNIYQYASSTSNSIIVVLPKFSNIDAGTHWLRLQARVSSGAPGSLSIGYVTDASDYSSFTSIEDLSITNTSYGDDSEYTVVVPTSVPDNARLAIKNNNDGKSYYWDDVYWEETPSCLAPGNIEASNITLDSADISWTELGDATQWEVIYGETGFDVESEGESITIDDDSNVTLTGLLSATSYDVYVKTICGTDDESELTGPISFNTACETITEFPWTESFEDADSKGCWSQEYVSGTDDWNLDATTNQNSTISPRTGDYMAEFRVASFNGETTKLISPTLDLSSLDNPELEFYFANAPWGSDVDELRVYYKTSDSADWVQIGEDYVDSHSSWTQVVLNLPEPSSTYYIAFEGKTGYARGLDIDDITVSEGEPAEECESPLGITVDNVTGDGAEISWSPANPGDDLWEISLTTGGQGADDGIIDTVSGTPSYTATGLEPETEYSVYLRTICSDEVSSEWAYNGPFTTGEAEPECNAPTDVEVTDVTETTADVSWTAGGFESQWEVLYGETGFDIESEGESIIVGQLSTTIAELDPETEYDVYVRSVCGDFYSDWVGPETFTTEEEPVEECEAPTDVEVTEITPTTAEVTWTAGGDETIWTVIYGLSGFTQADEDDYETELVFETNYVMTDLEPETDYDVYIVSVCDAENMIVSDQVGPVTFTTEEMSVDSQEFNNFTYYPNPVEDQLSLKAGTQIENVQVYNLLGQQVIGVQPNSLDTQINTEALQAGVYLMKVSINGSQKTFRIVKK